MMIDSPRASFLYYKPLSSPQLAAFSLTNGGGCSRRNLVLHRAGLTSQFTLLPELLTGFDPIPVPASEHLVRLRAATRSAPVSKFTRGGSSIPLGCH